MTDKAFSKSRFSIRLDQALERYFPEQHLFLKSARGTRFIRFRPKTIAAIFGGISLLMAWTAIVTAVFLMDTISAGNARQQIRRDQRIYQERLNAIVAERDQRGEQTELALGRFYMALGKISQMQSLLLASEDRRRELETGVGVIQSTLRTTMKERDTAREQANALRVELQSASGSVNTQVGRVAALDGTLDVLADALDTTASQRDASLVAAKAAKSRSKALQTRLRLTLERNTRIFGRLEKAVTASIAPLDKMFRKAGMPIDRILEQLRRGYSGQGGPLIPIAFSGKGAAPDPEIARANALMAKIADVDLYRIAAEKSPLAMPVHSVFRQSSSFGWRSDPYGRGRRMHTGLDMASARGTPIYATGDGVIEFAGRERGYGKMIKLRHSFGFETFYAHLSRIRVKKGQRVSRGERIGDMGSTGRSTGPHLHYEVRVGGKPVNPQIYIKAGKNVF